MEKNILVIGGSYFIGRIFCQALAKADGYVLHVLNRGRFPLKLKGVFEYKCDRHDGAAVKEALPAIRYDAVVDFCAYTKNDVKSLLEHIPGEVGQYIYISSCAVFLPSVDYPKTEDCPKVSSPIPGPAGEYAYGKALLEEEAGEICAKKGIPLTILRPSFVYGPYNYAPRESFFFDLILSGKEIPHPAKSLALFQFVYVRDIAQILIGCLANPIVYENDYILSAPALVSYDKLLEVFSAASGQTLRTKPLGIDEIEEKNIPLPFPLEGHEIFSGEKIARAISFAYTPFLEGMRETFDFYKKYVYRG